MGLVRVLLDAGANPNRAGKNGVTALMLSSKSDSGVCALLLERGADELAVDESGASALHWATKRGQAASIALLSRPGALALFDGMGKRAWDYSEDWPEGSPVRAALARAQLMFEVSGRAPAKSARKAL